jgi:hypothetical protein
MIVARAEINREAAPEDCGLSANLVGAPPLGGKRRLSLPGADLSVKPRPQACSYQDPEAFHSDLEHWLADAQASLQEMTANPGRPGNETRTSWLRFEIRTARAEIDLLPRVPRPGPPAPEEPASHPVGT